MGKFGKKKSAAGVPEIQRRALDALTGLPPKGETIGRKLRTKNDKKTYSKKKENVEVVFGRTKDVRGIRSFLLRGIENVQAEWDLICLTHNIRKLWGHFCPDGRRIAPAFC